MNWKLEKSPAPKPRHVVIPEVGQAWKYNGYSTIYIRVMDSVGISHLGNIKGCFYSVDSSGDILYASLNEKGIVLLDMKFYEKKD